ncbi:hypothetical protein C9374_009986 [Naegleria lovaniensis]|uniref:Uncharacterized protein n=1 Tax=Naegleria lovaniensis TaxID=51637 RepID=A0AA88KEV7_NAELO|nr:uncharacterized protein C9374_009986 [Naegleria lovaniensis]KAG2375363.1 hypothetical protein C9374_009986 [Naegleria lovaniensis]
MGSCLSGGGGSKPNNNNNNGSKDPQNGTTTTTSNSNHNNNYNNNTTNHSQQQQNGQTNVSNNMNGNNGSVSHRSNHHGGSENGQTEDIKILLLGSGESGKSTLFKQIKITEKGGFTKEEVSRYLNSIYGNIIQTIDSLLTVVNEKGQSKLLPTNSNRVARVRQVTSDDSFLWCGVQQYNEDLALDIEELYKDPAITEAFDRQKTTGINDTTFEYKGYRLKVVDVGGQRPERKKWINSYAGVHAVIFVASLGDYDQVCYEDDHTNRMSESIDLFEETINSRHFQNTMIILLLNKTDVFSRKIKEKSIRTLFPDYEGADTFEESVKFIEKKYLDANKYDPNRIFTFWSCATETESIKQVFNSVKDKVLELKMAQKPNA